MSIISLLRSKRDHFGNNPPHGVSPPKALAIEGDYFESW